MKGSIPWLAVEFLKEGEVQYKHTKETDVWAFGMTIYVREECIYLNEEYGITDKFLGAPYA